MDKIDYYTEKDIARWETGRVRNRVAMLWHAFRWWMRFYIYPFKAYRDGMPGFVASIMGAFGLILTDFKMWEKLEKERRAKSG